MLPTPEEQLLKMSISGKLPSDLQQSFDEERIKGNTAYRQARYEDAIKHYNEAEVVNPMSPVPPANRSMVYLKLRNFEKAKQEAAIAHELHQALPPSDHSDKLLVKILLRRATANKELLLVALAAEDFQAVLDIENNDIARTELAALQQQYNLRPHRPRTTAENRSGQKIQVVNENDKITSSQRPTTKPRPTQGNGSSRPSQPTLSSSVQDETALVQLPKSVIQNLLSSWTSVPPRSSDEFERVWRSLHGDTLAQAKYLINIVGPYRIRNGILGDSLTPQLLESFIGVLAAAVQQDPVVSTEVANTLGALTSVSRFEMLLMFLSQDEKKPVFTLLESLQTKGVSQHQVRELEQAYA